MLRTDRLFHRCRPCVYPVCTVCFFIFSYISNEYIIIGLLFRVSHQPFRRRNIFAKFRHAGVMRKVHISCLTVAVLRHHHHSQTLRRILAYRFCLDTRQRRAVKQHHHVRVLLDSPAFTQVAQDRTAERPGSTGSGAERAHSVLLP